jgi:glycosyltransferase involved in cell wall biosynthesis
MEPILSHRIKVCHVATADLWAGAQVQLAILLASLAKIPDLDLSAILFNEGRLAHELEGIGVRATVVSESRHNSLGIVKQLINHLRQDKIDILHTHNYKDNILAALSSPYRGVCRVRTIHGFREPFARLQAAKMSIYQLIDDSINRWCVDRLLAVSLDLKEQLAKRFGADKVAYICNAVDIKQIRGSRRAEELREELELYGDEFLIGTMGRLMPVKGFDSFLKAACLIRRERPNVKFIIAGDGPLRASLQALAREYSLDKDVLFIGHRNDSYDILGLLNLFILPSLSEGTPMVLLEALALERPVVASRVGGIPEVVEHGISGLLVRPGREDEIAQSCITLMDNYDFARHLGAAGRKRVEEQFSAKVMADKVAQVYRTLVGGRKNI